MSRHSLKHLKSIFEFAGREVTTVNLKVIFDNVRNYGLAALALKGSQIVVAQGGVNTFIGCPALFISSLLIAANIAQSYLIAYKHFAGSQKNRLGSATDSLHLGFTLWCGLLSIIAGGSLVYVIFKAIPF